ncbi:hypothetical protein R5R35_004892 [Gryllus longicercus]|uniref:Secreted protein n=1 Tax=Gryllus longicercus TaxID=2509291 RepID=A0AAN9Z052_9ORTH
MRWLLLCFFVFANVAVLAGQFNSLYATEDDDSDDNNCLPKLADECFKYVSDNLNCHLNPNISTECEKKDAADLCSAIDGGLKCARDIIDGDCDVDDGRDHFDLWMNGLEKMYKSLCSSNMQLLKVLLESSHCWNSGLFIKCLEEEKNILHIVDFLKVDRDLNNCYHLTINLASCSTRASSQTSSCVSPQNAIKELLHTFFTAGICSDITNSQPRGKPFLELTPIFILIAIMSRLILFMF